MSSQPSSPTARARRGAAVLAGLAAPALALTLLACSGGDTMMTVQQAPATDTYLLARITVLDIAFGDGPEFFHCGTLEAVEAGEVYEMRAELGTAGITTAEVDFSRVNVTLTGTDITTEVGLALAFRFSPSQGIEEIAPIEAETYVDLYLPCDRQSPRDTTESRLTLKVGDPRITLTIDSYESVGDSIVPAETDPQSGSFSPAGIMEGTFSFPAEGNQVTGQGTLSPQVLVEGCFRLNVPFGELGVPVTPSPTTSGAGCP